ncbi:MAG: DUF1501 domain-containing protein [Planctomycetota bacterium]|nr:DUF1501 domain-containing protein [Planctomycetota bacterium]
MLIVSGDSRRFCDGVHRRGFLAAGFLGCVGLSLADLLRAERASAAGRSRRRRSVILVWQHGGPSQLDTFDMKPDAPSEYRGPYRSIPTSVPGLRISERMPYHARVMDKMTVIRSFTHANGDHFAAAHWLLTGYLGANGSDRQPRNPSMGAIASRLLGPGRRGVPAYVNINDGGFGFHGAAYLGVAYNPFRTGSFSYGNEGVQLPSANASSLKFVEGLTETRVERRVSLLDGLDRIRRDVDQSGTFESMDRVMQEAVDIVTSGRAREAFDLSREDPRIRELYGPGWGEQALLARRLIEAGVRFVTLNTGYWDDHGNIKRALDSKLPRHDRAVGVLIQDLAQRGLLDDTLVVTAGEFGRTPRINKDAGRDHWPQAQSIALAGGGFRHGQVVGATNDKAEYPTERPVTPNDFCAIIYHALGIDPHRTTVDNLSGRPVYLLDGGRVPRELL